MFTNEEYKALVKLLRDNGLDVFVNFKDRTQLSYRTMEFPNILLGIRALSEGYELTTFFGKSACMSFQEIIEIIEYEWNKENWIYGQDAHGEFIELMSNGNKDA